MVKELSTTIDDAYEAMTNALSVSKGRSSFTSFRDSLIGIDSVKNSLHMSEIEDHGFTFITRPKCNLTTANLRSDRTMMMIDSLDPQTVAYAIRTFLDTSFIRNYKPNPSTSPFVNDNNPFIPILSNRLVGLSGWPDPVLDVYTSDQGYFSETMTYPNGHDQLSKNYDLTATFNDIQGSVILSIYLMWTRYLMLVTRGVMIAYMEDIEARRLGFTSSIYRFVLDPSKQYITKWAKATGCFPRSIPLGAYFNYDANANSVEGATNMSVPFSVAGKVEYLDPIIMLEFNTLVRRRNTDIDNFKIATPEERQILNFCCIPYIDMGTNRLQWRYDSSSAMVRDRLSVSTTSIKPDPESKGNVIISTE